MVIDCPPTLGLLTVNALVAATHLLIHWSRRISRSRARRPAQTIERVRQRPNPALKILGVLITMHDKRTALAATSARKSEGVWRRINVISPEACASRKVRPTRNRFSPPIHRATEYLPPVWGGHRSCLDADCLFPLRCVDEHYVAALTASAGRRSAGRSASTKSDRTRTSLGRSWATSPELVRRCREGHHQSRSSFVAWRPLPDRGGRTPLQASVPGRPARAAGGHSRRRWHQEIIELTLVRAEGGAGPCRPSKKRKRSTASPTLRLHARRSGPPAGKSRTSITESLSVAKLDAGASSEPLSAGRHFV